MFDHRLKARNADLSRLLAKAGLAAEQRDIADQLQAVLTDELHHRIKNMLAMVTAIVRQSMRGTGDLKQAETAITRRLVAMGKAQDLLRKADWKAADLGEVIRGAMDQHDHTIQRIHLDGPPIEAAAATILPLTLIINEFLHQRHQIWRAVRRTWVGSLTWGRDEKAETLVLHWRESGGPPVSPPASRSFGSSLIENALPRQMGGSGTLAFKPAGVTFDLIVPLEMLLAPA